jgi:hypothetical protein
MMDHPTTRDGFFSRHPRITMNVVTLAIMIGSVLWIVSALRSGRGSYGHTVEASPTMFWIEILAMGLIAVSATILAFRVAVKTIRWSNKSQRF